MFPVMKIYLKQIKMISTLTVCNKKDKHDQITLYIMYRSRGTIAIVHTHYMCYLWLVGGLLNIQERNKAEFIKLCH